MAGWIKLYRDIQNHWIWEDSTRLKWWIDLLLLVNHKEGKIFMNGGVVAVEAGEHLTSELKLAERWGVSRKRVHRFLELLENDGMILTEKGCKKGTTVKVCNYKLYQDNFSSARTTDGTTEGTNEEHQRVQQATHKQEVYKNDKEGKEIYNPPRAADKKFTSPTLDEVILYCRLLLRPYSRFKHKYVNQ